MCQINNKRIKLDNDLKVYKIVGLNANGIYSIFYKYEYIENSELVAKYIDGSINDLGLLKNQDIINDGFFHCMIDKHDAVMFAAYIQKLLPDYSIVIVKCIIPKDSVVYSGGLLINKFEYNSICSNKLIITDEIIY